MHQSLKPLVEIVLFNNAILVAAVGDVTEEESEANPADQLNSLKWTLGHVVTGRFVIGELTGSKEQLPWDGLFMDKIESAQVPTLKEIVDKFEQHTPGFIRGLALMKEKQLLTAPSSTFPTAEKTTLAAIAFLLQHESYHLGQSSYIRRFLGKSGLVEKLLSS